MRIVPALVPPAAFVITREFVTDPRKLVLRVTQVSCVARISAEQRLVGRMTKSPTGALVRNVLKVELVVIVMLPAGRKGSAVVPTLSVSMVTKARFVAGGT